MDPGHADQAPKTQPAYATSWPAFHAVCSTTADKCGRPNLSAFFQKGGDPAAPSDTATLLRLHPSHEPCRGNRPPCG